MCNHLFINTLRLSLFRRKNNQAPTPTNKSPLLDDAKQKRIQQVVGSFLYYIRVVNTPYWWLYLILPHNKLPLFKPPRNKLINYLTTCGPILVQRFAIVLPIWFSMYIPMPDSSLPCMPVAALVVTSSLAACQSTVIQSNSMAPFISHALSSNLSLHLPLKLN